jgi:hypothetical protein
MGIMLHVHRAVPSGGLGEMTRRKREISGLANEQDFRGFKCVSLEV